MSQGQVLLRNIHIIIQSVSHSREFCFLPCHLSLPSALLTLCMFLSENSSVVVSTIPVLTSFTYPIFLTNTNSSNREKNWHSVSNLFPDGWGWGVMPFKSLYFFFVTVCQFFLRHFNHPFKHKYRTCKKDTGTVNLSAG